ncbi:hypothetical protein VSR71_14595 [Cupriavidus oxalaticus]
MISQFARILVVASTTLTVAAALSGGHAHAAEAVVAGMDRTGVSASPARKPDPFTDGARIRAYDPYTDGARAGEPDSFTKGL